jgi:uncharacterized protein
VSLGPLPTTVSTLEFKAVQTYSDGQEVAWIQDATPGGAEPDHPAPTLTLTAAGAPGGAATMPGAGDGGDGSDGTARALAVVALVVGVLGLAAGGLGLARGKGRPQHGS